MKIHRPSALLLAAGLLTLPLGCAGGGDGGTQSECRGSKCDALDVPDSEVDQHPCDSVMHDLSGRNNGRLVNRLDDPLVNLALKAGDSCPTTFSAIMAKLRETDTDGCEGERDGITTRAISETAQLTEEPTNYRLVTTRKCGGRPKHGLIFSLFNVSADASSLPGNVEIIAFDESQGIFNYYESTGDTINFFGNSKDLLKGSPDGQTRRCAMCHSGGGLVMKELPSPWIHWEGDSVFGVDGTPGASDLIEAHADLGTRTTGVEFEGVVRNANKSINEKRLANLREGFSTKDVLRPLFCTVEINLDTGADKYSPADLRNDDSASGCTLGQEGIKSSSCDNLTEIPLSSMLDPQIKGFGSIPIETADYQALIQSSNQRVADRTGRAHTTKFGGETIDTVFDYAYPERSAIDDDYLSKLKSAGIVDDELIKDVLMVDFTRPIFSGDRCGLLEFAPVLSSDQLNPDAIRQGFIDNLGSPAAGSPEAELLANLQNRDIDHDQKVNDFVSACKALDKADFLENAYTVTTLNRRKAREMPIMEFSETMPQNDLNVADGTRLDPTTCQLTTSFVAVSTAAGASSEPAPDPQPDPQPEPSSNPCAHSPCEAGPDATPLDPQCDDPRVASVCESDAFCCNTDWDSTCVSETPDCN